MTMNKERWMGLICRLVPLSESSKTPKMAFQWYSPKFSSRTKRTSPEYVKYWCTAFMAMGWVSGQINSYLALGAGALARHPIYWWKDDDIMQSMRMASEAAWLFSTEYCTFVYRTIPHCGTIEREKERLIQRESEREREKRKSKRRKREIEIERGRGTA